MSQPDAMTCSEVFRRLDDYLDRELSAEELLLVRAHLETCAVCASEHRFEQTVLNAVKDKVRRLPVPPELAARVRAALARAK
jgi:anti-sigma factor (TIGR02949 family)